MPTARVMQRKIRRREKNINYKNRNLGKIFYTGKVFDFLVIKPGKIYHRNSILYSTLLS